MDVKKRSYEVYKTVRTQKRQYCEARHSVDLIHRGSRPRDQGCSQFSENIFSNTIIQVISRPQSCLISGRKGYRLHDILVHIYETVYQDPLVHPGRTLGAKGPTPRSIIQEVLVSPISWKAPHRPTLAYISLSLWPVRHSAGLDPSICLNV